MTDLNWFSNEPPEMARLAHYVPNEACHYPLPKNQVFAGFPIGVTDILLVIPFKKDQPYPLPDSVFSHDGRNQITHLGSSGWRAWYVEPHHLTMVCGLDGRQVHA